MACMRRWITRLFIGIAGAYLAAVAYLYMFQEALIFKPDGQYAPPDRDVLPQIEEVQVMTEDGIALTSWFQPPPEGALTILYLHGNAGGLTKRTDFYRQIIEAGYGLLALDWRGYSKNDGSPSEQGLYMDARGAMVFLANQGITPEQVIVMGRSLGSGVATWLAMEYALFGMVLVSPYTSIADIARERYPLIPVAWLLNHPFNSLSRASSIDEPVLIVHGQRDRVIPVEHAQHLYQAFNQRKILHLYEDAGHNDVPFDDVMARMQAFFSENNTANTSQH